MRHNFSYRLAGQNEVLDSMVAAFSELVDTVVSKDKNVEDYKANNKLFSEAIVKFCVEAAGREYTGLDMVKDPMVTVNSIFRDTFATVISQVITPLVPKITSERYNSLYDVTQVGFGDNASYIVESNDEDISVTESNNILVDECDTDDETRYNRINLMLMSRNMNEERTLIDSMKTLVVTDYLAEKMFKIL